MIGQNLAHYEITAKLGEGGMGAVYRATDTKLGREVALKVLTGLADQGPERLSRFQQEARTIAALNHPNIVTLHAVEEHDGVPFLVMELIDGDPLTKRIAENGLELDDLLRLAVPVADAVSNAHRQGITHRDLKPDNVMIDAEGRPKVLDFGLAKLLETNGDATLTRTMAVHQTQEGRIVGTAAYMSPEQAEGKPVDARSDVFSLGIVLYEMATGKKPFEGDTPISMISSIVKEQPRSALEIKQGLPRQLGRILDRCLAKDPDRRYQSAIELRNELELLDHESKSGELEMWVPADTTGAPRTRRRGGPIAVAVAAALVLGALAGWLGRGGGPEATVGIPVLESVAPMTTEGNLAEYPSLSPAGDLFVYQARGPEGPDIFVQRIGGQRPINLTADHDGLDRRPAVSPDGQRIVFESSRDGGGLFVMGTTGERVRRVTDFGHDPAWSPDGTRIVFTSSFWVFASGRDADGVLHVVDAQGGTPRPITPDTIDAVQPDWSPDGRRIAFWGVESPSGRRDIYSIGVDGEGLVRLTDDEPLDFTPRYGPEGRSVWFVSNRAGTYNLWRLPIDPRSGAPTGEPMPVTVPNDEVERFDIEGDRIAFGAPDTESHAVRVDLPHRQGELGVVRTLTRGSQYVSKPRLSPDGTRISFYTPIGTGTQDLYLANVDGSGLRRLTDDAFRDRGLDWHPSGERLVFYSDRGGSYEIWTIRPDGSDPVQISDIAGSGLDTQWYPRYSADGTRIATVGDEGTTVWTVDPDTGRMRDPVTLRPPVGARFHSGQRWHPREPVLLGSVGDRPSSSTHGLWTYDVERDAWTPIVEGAGDLSGWDGAAFSNDGRTLFLSRNDSRLVALAMSDVPYRDLYEPRIRVVAEDIRADAISVSPDGTWLLVNNIEFGSEIWGVRLRTRSR